MKDGKRRRSKQPKAAAPVPAVERILSFSSGASAGVSHWRKKNASDATRLRSLLERDYYYVGATKKYGQFEYRPAYDQYPGGAEYHRYEPRKSRAVQGSNVRVLYHGTSVGSLEGILNSGLRPSFNGLLGPGIYLGGRDKAECYFRNPDAGVLLMCRVNLGKVFEARPSACGVPFGYDSVKGVPGVTTVFGGATLVREEFIVRDKSQIEIAAIWLYKGRERECSRCAKVYFESRLITDQAYLWLCKSCA